MSDNILTAKEWLEKDPDTKYIYEGHLETIEEYAERYASYKTKVLEDRIGEFKEELRNRYEYLKQDNSFGDNECSFELEDCIKEYKKHFNIN